MQFNTCWECAAIPYLPVLPLIERHLRRLDITGVMGLMLSWTLGGYPSLTLEFASHYYRNEPGQPLTDSRTFAAGKFGALAGARIAEAWETFSRAFGELPLSNSFLYAGPQNFGPANLLYLTPTGYRATMVGYPYDDLARWRGIYPEEIFSGQLEKLVRGWQEGLEQLDRAMPLVASQGADDFLDMRRMALAAGHHFRSAWNQTEFVRLRDRWLTMEDGEERNELADAMSDIAVSERQLAASHIKLMREDSKIGFEASCHYF